MTNRNPADSLREQLLTHLEDGGFLPAPGGTVLFAASAGLDSTVLARLLAPDLQGRGFSAHLAHVEHRLRGEDSDDDRDFVLALGQQLGLHVHCLDGTIQPDRIHAIGQEAAAREVRLAVLEDLARRLGASFIYLAHHEDDQLETILLRLEDGVPASRAAGMPAQRGLFCRPLLGVSRTAIEAAADASGWAFRVDPSNRDLRFARNRIRHEVLPRLRLETPDEPARLLREGRAARARLNALEAGRLQVLDRVLIRRSADRIHLDRSALSALSDDEAILLLQSLCSGEHPCDRPPLRAALHALLAGARSAGPARRYALGTGWFARVDRDELLLATEALAPEDEPTEQWSAARSLQSITVAAPVARHRLASEDDPGRAFATFDADRLQQPLSIVPAATGLHMRPFGMEGHRSVRDLLAEAGVPRSQRANWPVVLDSENTVIWIPGVRASNHAILDASSIRAVMLYTTAPLGPACERSREVPADAMAARGMSAAPTGQVGVE